MSRWEPNPRGRLEQAAFELFLERGYDQTSVADIAARAGLTERTFFRHFADKREVLFGGSAVLQHEILQALEGAPPTASALEAVRVAVEAASDLMKGRLALARERRTIVAAHTDLQERELIKRATLTLALAEGLQRRGVPVLSASLAADMGIGVFYVGFSQWYDDPAGRELTAIVSEGFDRIKSLADGVS